MIDSGVAIFTMTYFLSVASAGPGIAALVSRALGHGWDGVPAFILGFIAADLIWLSVAVTGVSALAQRAAWLLVVLKYAGAAYLLYLAYRMWTRTVLFSGAPSTAERSDRLFLAGLFMTLGNPKPMMFFLAVVPAVVDLEGLSTYDLVTMFMVIPLVLITVAGGYAWAAVRLRGFFRHPRAFQVVNRVGAVVMAGAAFAVIVG